MKLKTIMLFVLTLFLSSCSSYMNAIYKDFEDQEKSNPEIDAQDSTLINIERTPKEKLLLNTINQVKS